MVKKTQPLVATLVLGSRGQGCGRCVCYFQESVHSGVPRWFSGLSLHLTLDLSSGFDFRVVSLSPQWAPCWVGSLLKKKKKKNKKKKSLTLRYSVVGSKGHCPPGPKIRLETANRLLYLTYMPVIWGNLLLMTC